MDKLILNSANNETLADYLATKKPGDKCKMEVEGIFTGDDKDEAIFRITRIKLSGKKPANTPSRVQDSDYESSPVASLYDE